MNLRQYISRLEAAGELVRVAARVDLRWEIAEITDRMSKSEGGGRALLFENTGTEFPVLTNMMGSERRMSMALGVDSLDSLTRRIDSLLHEAMSPKNTLMDKLRMLPLLHDMSKWFPRKLSSRGECQQTVMLGDDVDLGRLPALTSWGCDGGPFITLPMVHTVDPESGIPNMGMYRMQIFDSRTTGMHWHRHKTGFLRRRPVRLVKCLTNELWVPEDCDFVIEGYVDPSEELAVEGAFGDHTGFYSLTDLYPRLHVTAITHRRDAVYPATVVGVPPMEDAYIAQATERIFLAPIRLAVQPEVVDLTMPTAGTAHNIAFVSIAKRYPGQPLKVAQGLWGAGQMMFNKYLLLADAEYDIRDAATIMALLRRLDTRRGLLFSEGVLDILDHATSTQGYGSKLAVDCTDIDISQPPVPIRVPGTASPAGGVELFNTAYVERMGLLILYAEREWRESVDVERYLADNGMAGMKYVVLFDRPAAGNMRDEDLLWLAAANTDPRRDMRMWGDTLIVDARSKRPGYGDNPPRFPNVATSLPETIHLVDDRWPEYGLGEMLPSPSRRYRKLWLSDGAEW